MAASVPAAVQKRNYCACALLEIDAFWGNGFKLREVRFKLDVRKKFFTQRVKRCWHRLLREAVGDLPLEAFKARLNGALGSLI